MRTRIVVLGLLCSVALLVLWMLEEARPGAPGEPGALPLEPRTSREPSRLSAVETGAEATKPAAEARATVAAPEGMAATLVVRAVSTSGEEPVADARVVVQAATPYLSGTPEGSAARPVEAHTDVRGEARMTVPSGEALELRVIGTREGLGRTSMRVAALAPAEERELRVDLPAGSDQRYWGKLVSDADGGPVEGARIRLMSGGAANSAAPRLPDKKLATERVSDRAGLFGIEFSSWSGFVAHVEAEGYAPALVGIGGGHEEPERAEVLRLAPAASLWARVIDSRGRALPGAVVRLSTSSMEISRPQGSYVMQKAPEWSAVTDGQGACLLEGLPPEVPLAVELSHAGERSLLPDPVVLEPGLRADRELQLGGCGTLVVVLLDPAGRAIAQHEVWLVRADGAPGGPAHYFTRSDSGRTFARTVTDESGRATLTDVPLGAWWVGPAAAATDVSPEATRVVLASCDVPLRQSLTAARTLFVRGLVLGPDGAPAPGHPVEAIPAGSSTFLLARTDPEGAFELGPVSPGTFSVRAGSGGGAAPSAWVEVEVEAGVPDVRLELLPGASVRGRVIDADTGAAVAAEILASNEDDRIRGLPRTGWSGPDVDFLFDGLPPGRYTLAARTRDGRVGSVRDLDVSPGARLEGVTVFLQLGAQLRLRHAGAASLARFLVFQDGALVGAETLHAGGARWLAVPAGDLLVRELAEGELVAERRIALGAGDEVSLELGD